MYYVNDTNDQVRIDKAGNVFYGKRCMNPSASSPISIAENTEEAKSNPDLTEGLAVKVVGHLSSFEYGHTRDEDGSPVCIKVCTGFPAWDLDKENDALIERSIKASNG